MIGFPVLTSADSDLLPIANGTFTPHDSVRALVQQQAMW